MFRTQERSGGGGSICLHGCSQSAIKRFCDMPAAGDSCLHLLLQENNFKAVLESMRDLMNEQTIVPPWLHDTFLGYGDPAAAQYTRLPDFRRSVDIKVVGGETLQGGVSKGLWWSAVRSDAVQAADALYLRSLHVVLSLHVQQWPLRQGGTQRWA